MKQRSVLLSLVLLFLTLNPCRTDDEAETGSKDPSVPAADSESKELDSQDDKNATNSSEPGKADSDTESSKAHDDTGSGGTKSFKDIFASNSDMLKRAMYVTIAITGILLLYFGIRFVRSRKRRVKRYGPLLNPGDNVEMAPLASDSDEDMTVFDARRNLVQ